MAFNLRRCFVFTVLLVVLSTFLFGCAGSKKPAHSVRDNTYYLKEHGVEALPRFDMPIEVNDRVIAWIEYFQGAGRKHFERYLARSGKYLPMMRQILKEEGLPQDLVYISMIESGFSPHAYSSASAVGLWQFMKATGGMYGLKVDSYVDERRDPYKATRAAARHFKDLYNDCGDWYLAMVGYNAGPGRIKKAKQLSGSDNFWDMANHRTALRAETRDYVPKYVAAAIISKMPEKFGFKNVDYEEPLQFETATVDSQTDFKVISECSGVDIDTIKDLNPFLYKGVTPPTSSFEIRLPKGTSLEFKEKFASLPREERLKVARHVVRKGDTLPKIARRYGVGISAIASANNINTKKHLKRGSTLIIPTGAAALASSDDNSDSSGSSGAKKVVYHKVKKGETLARIAQRYKVKPAQILSWNKLGRKSKVLTGVNLKIYKPVSSGKVETTAIALNEKKTKKELKDTTAIKLGETKKIVSENVQVASQSEIPESDTAEIPSATEVQPVKEKRAQTYVVRKGETLGKIASKNGMTLKELMQINKIKDARRVKAGMKIKVKREGAVAVDKTASKKSAPDRAPEPKQPAPSPKPTTSKPTPTQFAKKSNAPVGSPVKLGGSAPNGAAVKATTAAPAGAPVKLSAAPNVNAAIPETAVLPKAATLPSVATKTSNENETSKVTYNVKNGDTLWDIARKHQVTISEIQKWNNLNDPSEVKPGMKLSIRKN